MQITSQALKDSGESALRDLKPESLLSFSLRFDNEGGKLSCLSIFSRKPTDDEMDMLSSVVAEIEAEFWAMISTTEDKYISIAEHPNAMPLEIVIYEKL